MRDDDFHLERIILIDSYREGDIVEVRLDGHVNINGFNAAGKTTLLRTIPLFYGEAAARMLKGEQGKKAFTDHYLPRTTSYIVFEYVRRGQPCMAVLHSNTSGESVQYRFIDTRYRKDLFVVGQAIVESNTQLLRHVEKQGAQCTRAFSRAEYRSIIQNDVDKRELRSLASRFAFVGAGSRLSHIDRIVTGMFVRATTFRDLRQIIVASIDQNEGQLEIRAQRDQMDVWIRDHDAYVEVMRESNRVEGLLEANKRRQAALASLSLVKGQLLALQRMRSAQLEVVTGELKALEDRATTARADTLQAVAEANGRLKAKEGELEHARAQLDRLEAQAKRYRDEGFEERAQAQDDLASIQAELEVQEKSHTTLLGSQRSVSEEYERLELVAKQQAGTTLAELEKNKAPIYDEMDRLKTECEEHYQRLEQALREKHERELREANDNGRAIAERIGWLNGRIKDAQASPELVVQKEAKDEECEAARVEVDRARIQRDDAQRTKLAVKTAFEEADRQLGRIQTRLQDQQVALQAAMQVGDAAPGTLVHFLRNHLPDWRENIGKLASRELLLRNDLAPELDHEAGQSLYGVQLRLDRVEAPWHAHEEAIESRIAQLKDEIDAEQKRHALQDAALKEATASVERAAKAEDDASRAYQVADERSRRLAGEQQSLKRQLDDSRARAKKQAQEDLREVTGQKQALDAEIKQLNAALAGTLGDNASARQQALSALETTKTNKLAAIASSIRQVRGALQRELGRLQEERHRSLSAKGIDSQTLARLEEAITSLKGRIERIRRDAPAVAQYRVWLQSQWPLRAQYGAQVQAIERDVRQLKDDVSRMQTDGEKILAALAKEIDALEKREHGIAAELSAVKARLEKLAFVREDADAAEREPDGAHTLTHLDHVKRENENVLLEADRRIEDDVAVILRAFTKHRGTAPDRFYESCRSDLAAANQRGREWIPAIEEWFVSRHLEARRVLRDGASLLGQTVDEFYGALKAFKNRAQSFSRELQTCIDSSADFDKISNVQARIQTTVDALDYWGSIAGLSEEFRLWFERQDDDLPHQEFCQALRRVAQCFDRDRTLSADLVDLIQLEIDLVENGRHVTVRDERALEHVSSNGLSYLILIVLFLGFLQRIRKDSPVQVLCAVDELKNLDLANTERLFGLLDRHRVTLISAFPDADPEVLRLFSHRYTILPERRVAKVVLDAVLDDGDEPASKQITGHNEKTAEVRASEPSNASTALSEGSDHV